MFSTLVSIALFSSLAVRGALADISISTPELVQCGKVQVTWEPTQGPYDLILAPPDDPCNKVLLDLGGNHESTSATVPISLAAGTQAIFSIVDANGDEGWSGTMTVQGSNDVSCLSLAAASSSAASSSAVSSSASQSSGSSTPAVVARPATTLVVPPASQASSASGSVSTDTGAVPVGAANAGLNPTSGAANIKFSAPVMAFSAIAAAVLAVSF